MKWYFVANGADMVDTLLEHGVKDILLSYAYFKRGIPASAVAAFKAKKINLMVDSGGYTNTFKPGSVTLNEYMDWLGKHHDLVTEYVVMDDPRKRENTLANFKTMAKAGLRPIIVDHVWFEWAPVLHRIYSVKDMKVCWGGMLSAPDGPMGHWAKRMVEKAGKHPCFFQDVKTWANVLTRVRERHEHATRPPLTKIHLLAVGQRLRKLLPFFDVIDSFDSSTWSMASGYGRLIMMDKVQPGVCPTCRQIKPDNPPPEFLQMAEKYGADHTTWKGRRVIAIKELQRFYGALEKFYEEEKEKGFDHLLNIALTKRDEEEAPESLGPREVLIQVPLFFDDGTVLVKSEADLLDIGVEAKEELAEVDIYEVEKAMKIQTLIFSKDAFDSAAAAQAWAKQHAFRSDKVDETGDSYRLRQVDPSEFDESSFRTITITDGVKAVVGQPKAQKRDDEEERVVKLLPVEKAEDKQIVLGIVSEPDTVDAQGDTISAEEIENAAHEWLAKYQDRGYMHQKIVNGKIEIFESYVVPVTFSVGGQQVKKGTWLLMYHITDGDLWQQIKSGKLTGFSLGGFARRTRPGA